MKNPIILLFCTICAIVTNAQVGIGTTTPNSTLDVQGSLAAKTTISTSATNTLGSEYIFIYTGGSAATATLPDATTIIGRMYTIKNSSSFALTINTTLSQQIDGSTSYALNSQYQTATLVSTGTAWNIIGYGMPEGSYWAQNGNNVASEKSLGTISDFDLPIIANGSEKMRVFSSGSVSVGSDTLDPDSPEVLRVDGRNSTSYNLINGVGTRNGFLQFNIQNLSNGANASSDIVATANNGTNSSVYVDLGINSQGYSNSNSNILNGSNTAYLYSSAADFYIGNGATNKDLVFFTNSGAVSTVSANGTKRMTIKGSNGQIIMGSGNAVGTNVLTVGGEISASAFNVNSDKRLKTNIRSSQYGLKEIMQFRPVSWNWKDRSLNTSTQLGLIAQDAKKVIPEIVSGNEQTTTLSINYTELIPVLINAIKEQQQQIEELKKKVKRLEHK
jgi:hypothetical protein